MPSPSRTPRRYVVPRMRVPPSVGSPWSGCPVAALTVRRPHAGTRAGTGLRSRSPPARSLQGPQQAAHEASRQQILLDRTLDLMLVTALRAWFTRPGAPVPAWYRAHSDPVVGPALRLLRADPAHPWTLPTPAARTGVSRANLARRFTALVGQPPMTFLREQRLTLAADLLREPDATPQWRTASDSPTPSLSAPRSRGNTASARASTGHAKDGRKPDLGAGPFLLRSPARTTTSDRHYARHRTADVPTSRRPDPPTMSPTQSADPLHAPAQRLAPVRRPRPGRGTRSTAPSSRRTTARTDETDRRWPRQQASCDSHHIVCTRHNII